MNQNIFQQLAAKHINRFVEDLGDDLRKAVQSTWAGSVNSVNATPTKRKYTKKATTVKPVRALPSRKVKAVRASKKGAKRGPKGTFDYETLQNVLTAINVSPDGVKGADIIEALKIPKALWVKTIKYAINEGYVKTTGSTRSMLYFIGKPYTTKSNGAATAAPAVEATA